MLKTMYLSRGTVVHRIDPRTKILSFAILSTILFIFNHPLYVGMIAIGVLGLVAVAESLENCFRMRYLLVVSVIVPAVVWQFDASPPAATPIAHFWFLTITRQSLLYGIAAGLRYASVLMLGILFSSIISVEELTLGLVRLRVPYPIAFMFSLTMRLVPTFASVLRTIVEAQVGRGLDLETRNPLHRARNLAPVIVPFLVYTIRYSSLFSIALETKGFSLSARRTYFHDPRMRVIDHIVLAGLLTAMTMFLLLRFRGYGAVIPGRI